MILCVMQPPAEVSEALSRMLHKNSVKTHWGNYFKIEGIQLFPDKSIVESVSNRLKGNRSVC